ncbi:hypothetical protein L1987_83697 [Smallanthus sonchifolius]|uniref:Uncharacterized protein n=1 Tax=Smallanthus sonchifolius TaxID=185202 RepID=A0ACB8YDC3_9ASTR|nr:hypothetical protein L1987_83697 [Smallanthus sonchifolius]
MVVLTEISEQSSSSSTLSTYDYDVFLSFRGIDTRSNFTEHLHKALLEANIHTFLDNTEIQIGEFLKPERESAIKSSRASVIVLSKNYASSTWCLDELALIMEQQRTSKHIVFPIFYHVKPSEVRKQENSFGDAMAKHKQRMETETNEEKRSQWAQKIEQWEKALAKLADLKGEEANGRRETILIEGIVKEIRSRLGMHKRSEIPHVIGIQSPIITSFLKDKSQQNTEVLTIWGMARIGKTYLANYIFQLHYLEFEISCFLEDIERRCKPPNGLLDLQKQLLKDIGRESRMGINNLNEGTLEIKKSLLGKRILLDKELFEHIACLFVGEDRKLTVDVLKECGIGKSSGIKTLIDRCLLTIGLYDKLRMHQLLQDMGRDIVHQESPRKAWKRRILWHQEECWDVLQNRQGTPIIQGLVLDMRTFENEPSKEPSSADLQKFGFRSLFNWVSGMCSSSRKTSGDFQTLALSEMPLPEVVSIDSHTQTEVQYKFKTQTLSEIDEEVLRSLGWIHIEYLNQCWFSTADSYGIYRLPRRILPVPAQMLYEHGISTYLQGQEVPNWFTHRSNGSSFTLQSSPQNGKIRGLNVCIVSMVSRVMEVGPSRIELRNLTKNSSWTYQPIMYLVPEDDDFEDDDVEDDDFEVDDVEDDDFEDDDDEAVVWLSHWMFRNNEFEDGDEVSVHVSENFDYVYDENGIGYDSEGSDYANVREYVLSEILVPVCIIACEFMDYLLWRYAPSHPFVTKL